MLIYKTMDATSVNTGIIAHGVNCQRRMASGIAKTIRAKFPQAYEAYMALPGGEDMLGTSHVVCINHEAELYVANMFTQVFYGYGGGKYADADAIEHALTATAAQANVYSLPIFMPRVGCGLGGLKWEDVEQRVLKVLELYPDVDIVVCDLPS